MDGSPLCIPYSRQECCLPLDRFIIMLRYITMIQRRASLLTQMPQSALMTQIPPQPQ